MRIKSFYIFGIFLVIFIAVSILWMIRIDAFAEKATNIYYRDKELEKATGIILKNEITLEEYVKTKSLISLELNGNEKHDDSILNCFRIEIQKILKAEDPKRGIHLKFGKKTTYENVVRSFQICKTENCRTYVPDGYDFWVFPYYGKTKKMSK